MAPSPALLERVLYDPGPMTSQLSPIDWPAGWTPKPFDSAGTGGATPLPSADVLVVTYTAAEGRALADVLTPGVQSTDWKPYTFDWSSFVGLLGEDAPALESKRLGSWYTTKIGSQNVVCFKSELHPATDGPKLPILKMWPQIIGQVAPSLVITTGTAGGVGLSTELGDVAVATEVLWDCTTQFAAEPWAHDGYNTLALTAATVAAFNTAQGLLTANAASLPPHEETRPLKIWQSGTTVTTDFFAWGDTNDHFGLIAAAPAALLVEMDDAALGLAHSTMENAPGFLSIRNASDPVMNGSLPLKTQQSQASQIYNKYGYFTTVGSAITTCAAITALV